jgi:Tfp pilus assembly protein PilF
VALRLLLAAAAWAAWGGVAGAGDRGAEVARWTRFSVCVSGDGTKGHLDSSGFVVEPGDRVITTAHGVRDARNLRVKLDDGRVFPARVERIGGEDTDLALLAVPDMRLEPASLGSVRNLDAGDEVWAIGCPLGFEFSVTRGVVSSLRDSEQGYPMIQTDVPVNPGSSGGPLFDHDGRVVGVIKSAAANRTRINFALPIDLGKVFLDRDAGERRAYQAFNRGVVETRPEQKVAAYREALRDAPDMTEAHYNLALALERLGQRKEAEAEYRAALRLQSGLEPAAINLGALLYDDHRLDEAIDVYRRALAAAPGSIALRNNLAETYRRAGQAENARREFEAILAARPDYAPAHYGLALLYDDQLRDRERAIEHYRRYLALAPDAADAGRVRDWLARVQDSDGRRR